VRDTTRSSTYVYLWRWQKTPGLFVQTISVSFLCTRYVIYKLQLRLFSRVNKVGVLRYPCSSITRAPPLHHYHGYYRVQCILVLTSAVGEKTATIGKILHEKAPQQRGLGKPTEILSCWTGPKLISAEKIHKNLLHTYDFMQIYYK
jgi:hypothetical protein